MVEVTAYMIEYKIKRKLQLLRGLRFSALDFQPKSSTTGLIANPRTEDFLRPRVLLVSMHVLSGRVHAQIAVQVQQNGLLHK